MNRVPPSQTTFEFGYPVGLDTRNIEMLAELIYDQIKDFTTMNQVYNAAIENYQVIADNIRDKWISDIKPLEDMQTRFELSKTKTTLVKLASFPYKKAVEGLSNFEDLKTNCLDKTLQYHSYVRCLACDASAENKQAVSFDFRYRSSSESISLSNVEVYGIGVVIDQAFYDSFHEQCADYIEQVTFQTTVLEANKYIQASSMLTERKEESMSDTVFDLIPTVFAGESFQDIAEDDNLNYDSFGCRLDSSNSSCFWKNSAHDFRLLDGFGATSPLLMNEGFRDNLPENAPNRRLSPFNTIDSRSGQLVQNSYALYNDDSAARRLESSSSIDIGSYDTGINTDIDITFDKEEIDSIELNYETSRASFNAEPDSSFRVAIKGTLTFSVALLVIILMA